MSISTRSKPGSPSSPESGGGPIEPQVSSVGSTATGDHPAKELEPTLEVELEMSRQRFAVMSVFGIVVGSLLIWKLGTVAMWSGVVLILVGAYRTWELIQTFVYPPGTIVVTANEVSLPRGLCLPRPVKVAPADVTAVYFLRRSVPWNRSAPVLVIEVGPKAMAFPRETCRTRHGEPR